jgi:hypothetical protein
MTKLTAGRLRSAEIRLANAVSDVAGKRTGELEKMKAGSTKYRAKDWIWQSLLLSFSTMGNSRGSALVHIPQIYSKVRFDSLRRLSSAQRRKVIRAALGRAKVLWPFKKAVWLSDAFNRIATEGGPAAVKDRLSKMKGKEAKLKFLMEFKGIGQKYARNMMMDVYDPAFRDSIAVDTRIRGVSTKLGLTFCAYPAEEAFYLRAARRAKLDGWTMDRILYNFTAEVTARLHSK